MVSKERDLGTRVLITGGAGFVGSRLARDLLKRGEIGGTKIDELFLTDLRAPAPSLTADGRVHSAVGTLVELAPQLGQTEPSLLSPCPQPSLSPGPQTPARIAAKGA